MPALLPQAPLPVVAFLAWAALSCCVLPASSAGHGTMGRVGGRREAAAAEAPIPAPPPPQAIPFGTQSHHFTNSCPPSKQLDLQWHYNYNTSWPWLEPSWLKWFAHEVDYPFLECEASGYAGEDIRLGIGNMIDDDDTVDAAKVKTALERTAGVCHSPPWTMRARGFWDPDGGGRMHGPGPERELTFPIGTVTDFWLAVSNGTLGGAPVRPAEYEEAVFKTSDTFEDCQPGLYAPSCIEWFKVFKDSWQPLDLVCDESAEWTDPIAR